MSVPSGSSAHAAVIRQHVFQELGAFGDSLCRICENVVKDVAAELLQGEPKDLVQRTPTSKSAKGNVGRPAPRLAPLPEVLVPGEAETVPTWSHLRSSGSPRHSYTFMPTGDGDDTMQGMEVKHKATASSSPVSRQASDDAAIFKALKDWEEREPKIEHIHSMKAAMERRASQHPADNLGSFTSSSVFDYHFATIHPRSVSRTIWCFAGFLFVIMDCVFLPLQIFDSTCIHANTCVYVLYWMAAVYWLLEIIMCFFHGDRAETRKRSGQGNELNRSTLPDILVHV